MQNTKMPAIIMKVGVSVAPCFLKKHFLSGLCSKSKVLKRRKIDIYQN